MSDWLIFQGTGEPARNRIADLPEAPHWRRFDGTPPPEDEDRAPEIDHSSLRRLGDNPILRIQEERTLQLINAALYLRRPLLVTGAPGAGKSTLAHAVAHELGLGRVLQWPVVSRTELKDGLYAYDAIGRLQDTQLDAHRAGRSRSGAARVRGTGRPRPGSSPAAARGRSDIGRYIRLGPLGTALLPSRKPRVLLIDELDKSDIDLPGDLLNVMEEGEFAIPELERIAGRDGRDQVVVLSDDGRPVVVSGGRVRCRAFPFIVMTSNGEREFPPALLRRCIHLNLEPPRGERLAAMVQAHFGELADETHSDIFSLFTQDAGGVHRPTDQLLNAIFLTQHAAQQEDPARRAEIARLLINAPDQDLRR
ncbi:AAA family ATPase [Streptomyces luteolus]|uniref:MoxR family ATPase n=1 Tax=Streptomyces luteolus TaxID=3043615 RepID=A0ABT6SQL0_9ACTN|nr:MoxR family ATPase [Streptomyces sp. B-S-A12]MDI3417129.1 MoxR family ATPase [Streptomyces sp. B-S-A12]